ncbi:MAG: class I SAM-dependent methyltransferase [Proteobacteria bacterium]|nr:class I SAM-dependent methyltransferase [Pseudomonadota bacterium]
MPLEKLGTGWRMPFSHSSQISAIIGYLEMQQPSSVLDIGVGMGQYGFLARTNLEHFNLYEVSGETARRRDKSEWNVIIDGIEAYPGYLTPVHEYAYNEIFEGDALQLLPALANSYDMVLAIDILEHFEKQDGLRFLELIKARCNCHALVSTPKDFVEQHVDANPFEDHRSHWVREDLEQAGFEEILANESSWVAVYSK